MNSSSGITPQRAAAEILGIVMTLNPKNQYPGVGGPGAVIERVVDQLESLIRENSGASMSVIRVSATSSGLVAEVYADRVLTQAEVATRTALAPGQTVSPFSDLERQVTKVPPPSEVWLGALSPSPQMNLPIEVGCDAWGRVTINWGKWVWAAVPDLALAHVRYREAIAAFGSPERTVAPAQPSHGHVPALLPHLVAQAGEIADTVKYLFGS